MEEDIKVLEEYIEALRHPMSFKYTNEQKAQVIENLIEGYKELEKYKRKHSLVKNNYIPKSKVREKINEKIEYYNSYKGLEIYKKDNFKEIVITLEQLKQQLLQEGDK